MNVSRSLNCGAIGDAEITKIFRSIHTYYNSVIMPKCKAVKCVIFDLDGTIIDTESVIQRLMIEFLSKYGIKIDEFITKQFMGRNMRDVYHLLKSTYDDRFPLTFDEFFKARTDLQEKHLKGIPLMPGAREVIEWFDSQKIPMAIGTSSSKAEVENKTGHLVDLLSKLHHITTSDGIRGKPAPDIYLKCLSSFPTKYSPENVLVFEDSLAGLQAARTAGLPVILVTKMDYSPEETSIANKHIRSFMEFDPAEFGLC